MLSLKIACVLTILVLLVGILSDSSYSVAAYKRDGSDESGETRPSSSSSSSSSGTHTNTHTRTNTNTGTRNRYNQESGETRHNRQDGPMVHNRY